MQNIGIIYLQKFILIIKHVLIVKTVFKTENKNNDFLRHLNTKAQYIINLCKWLYILFILNLSLNFRFKDLNEL